MGTVSPLHPRDRPSGETRTPVQIDADTYHGLRELAKADDRTITRYVNKVLRDHVERANIKEGR